MLELLKKIENHLITTSCGVNETCSKLISNNHACLIDEVCKAINEIEDYKDISERLERAKRDPGTELGDYIKELYEE